MKHIRTEELILLGGVMKDEAFASFCDAVKQEQISSYAKTYALLLEKMRHAIFHSTWPASFCTTTTCSPAGLFPGT